ncbi:MAG: aerotolerance regulator BatA [Elusimicrobia bacterium CG08_land_8_20_14_0_20_51_18]|nr:MAG: aerotolerance regulator BatA [Elusimicrobia bacterium CG08_land_8_20_14_0_20_51_18]
MIFRNPYLLTLLLPVVVLFFFARANSEKRLFNLKISTVPPQYRNLKLALFETLPFYMRLLALILAVFALARPQQILRDEIPPTEGVDIMLTLDTSPSMVALDFEPRNRMDAARDTAKDFIAKRQNDRIGLVVFGGVAVLSCPLTLDYKTLTDFLNTTTMGMTRSDGTAIGDAIATAVNHIKDSKAKSKIIILLTDGNSNVGTIADPVAAAKLARQFDIKIYTIGAAKKGESKYPTGNPYQPYAMVKDELNEATLMEVAKTTGGEFYRATNFVELQNIYARINELEKTRFQAKHFVHYTDLYNYFLIPALLLLVLVFILEKTVFLTVP